MNKFDYSRPFLAHYNFCLKQLMLFEIHLKRGKNK